RRVDDRARAAAEDRDELPAARPRAVAHDHELKQLGGVYYAVAQELGEEGRALAASGGGFEAAEDGRAARARDGEPPTRGPGEPAILDLDHATPPLPGAIGSERRAATQVATARREADLVATADRRPGAARRCTVAVARATRFGQSPGGADRVDPEAARRD